MSVLVSVGFSLCFATLRGAARIMFHENHKNDARLLRFLLHHHTPHESLLALSEMECWRRGWDLNPRMEVLQTSPLGLLGTAPKSTEYSETAIHLSVTSQANEFA